MTLAATPPVRLKIVLSSLCVEKEIIEVLTTILMKLDGVTSIIHVAVSSTSSSISEETNVGAIETGRSAEWRVWSSWDWLFGILSLRGSRIAEVFAYSYAASVPPRE